MRRPRVERSTLTCSSAARCSGRHRLRHCLRRVRKALCGAGTASKVFRWRASARCSVVRVRKALPQGKTLCGGCDQQMLAGPAGAPSGCA